MKKYSPRLELGLGTGSGIAFNKIISEEPLNNLKDIKEYFQGETWVKGIYGTNFIIVPPRTISNLSYYNLEGEAGELIIPKFNLEGSPIKLKIGVECNREFQVNFEEGDYSYPEIKEEKNIIDYFMNQKDLFFTRTNKENSVSRKSLIYLALTYPKQTQNLKNNLKNL
ncbi:MAG: hypothetical protein P8X70_01350 [Nanoarchaeota archaeon]